MSDWADEEAESAFPGRAITVPQQEFYDRTRGKIASALRAAHKRGMVEALREAIHELGNHTVFEAELLGVEYAINRLTARASALEQEST